MPLARKTLQASGIPPNRLVFVDDSQSGTTVNGYQVMSQAGFLLEPASSRFAAIAIANSRTRARLDEELKQHNVQSWTVMADNAVVFDDVTIGEGALISPFVTFSSNIRIGRQFHANLYSYVEHDCVVGDFVTLAPGAKINGNIVLEDHVYVGSGAVIRQGRLGSPVVIGKGAVIGMGAVVLGNVAPGVTVVGNPAKTRS